MCSILLPSIWYSMLTHTHTHTVGLHVITLSISVRVCLCVYVCVCDGWRGQCRESITSDQIFRASSTPTSTYSVEWSSPKRQCVHACVLIRCVCVGGCCAWQRACSCACSPKIRHVCTNLPNGSKVLLFCRVYTGGQHIRHYHSLLHRGCLAVSTHMLVQVTRSDSSMFAHICHFLLRVLIWTWCRSYVQREIISNGIMAGVLNGYRIMRRSRGMRKMMDMTGENRE